MNRFRLSAQFAVALAALVAFTGCHATIHVQPTQFARHFLKPERPLKASEHDLAEIDMGNPGYTVPTMIPIAIGAARSSSSKYALAVARKSARKIGADGILYRFAGSTYAGSTSAYLGFGVATSTPTYTNNYQVVFAKWAPVSTGIIHASDSGKVLRVEPPADSCGIQVGDELQLLGGSAWQFGQSYWGSLHFDVLATAKPGDEVDIVWVRPGEGRMNGVIKLAANDPTKLVVPKAPKVSKERRIP